MDSSVVLYEEGMSLQAIADELGLNPIKVRKLLITAGVYVSDMAEKVQVTFDDFRKTQDHKAAVLSTANALGLSRSSVTSYLPYKKGVYFPGTAPADKISVGAERQRRYRAMKRCRNAPTLENSKKDKRKKSPTHQALSRCCPKTTTAIHSHNIPSGKKLCKSFNKA